MLTARIAAARHFKRNGIDLLGVRERPTPIVILQPTGRAFVQGCTEEAEKQAKRMSRHAVDMVAFGDSVHVIGTAPHASSVPTKHKTVICK